MQTRTPRIVTAFLRGIIGFLFSDFGSVRFPRLFILGLTSRLKKEKKNQKSKHETQILEQLWYMIHTKNIEKGINLPAWKREKARGLWEA